MYGNGYQWIPNMKIKEANLFNTVDRAYNVTFPV
jgi:hypothetical protein